MATKGYGTNTGEMGRVAKNLRAVAEETAPKLKPIEAAANSKADLGRGHTDEARAYSAGLTKLFAAANSFVAATNDFAGRLDKTKGGYQWVETKNTGTVGGK